MLEGPPGDNNKSNKKLGDIIPFPNEEERIKREQKRSDLKKTRRKEIGGMGTEKRKQFSTPGEVMDAIDEYQHAFLVSLDPIVQMLKTSLELNQAHEFFREASGQLIQIYDWEKKLNEAQEYLQKIAGGTDLSAIVQKYLDVFETCHIRYEDMEKDEKDANKLLEKLQNFVEQNKKP